MYTDVRSCNIRDGVTRKNVSIPNNPFCVINLDFSSHKGVSDVMGNMPKAILFIMLIAMVNSKRPGLFMIFMQSGTSDVTRHPVSHNHNNHQLIFSNYSQKSIRQCIGGGL